MLLSCCFHVVVVMLSCCFHVFIMLLCCFHVVVVMLLSCCHYVVFMLSCCHFVMLSCCCHVVVHVVMLLSSCCHFVMLSFCHVVIMLSCCCHVVIVVMLLSSCCHVVIMLLLLLLSRFQRRFKLILVVLLFLATVFSLWFSLAIYGYVSQNPINYFFSYALVNVFTLAAFPIFYEAIVECSYPVSEGCTSCIIDKYTIDYSAHSKPLQMFGHTFKSISLRT